MRTLRSSRVVCGLEVRRSELERREWLGRVLGGICGICVVNRGVGVVIGGESGGDESPLTFRVRSVVELTGEVHLKSQGATTTRRDGKEEIARRAAVRSVATLDFDEQYVLGGTQDAPIGYQYFHEAKSEITVDRHETRTVLRENCREVVKWASGAGVVVSGVSVPLFSAERDLVEGSLDTVYLDQLLTDREVAIADKWTVDRLVVAKLFHLDAVLDGDLTVCLVELDGEKAHLEVEGKLQASVRDVPTEMVIKGKGLMDRAQGYLSWLAIQVDETRDIGEAEPGFAVTAQIRVLRAPIEGMSTGRSLSDVSKESSSFEAAELLQYQSDLGYYRFLADRRWSTYRDNGEEATLRYILSNRRVAQCNITNLVDFQPGEQLTLEGFQADLSRLASKTGREILDATEKLSRSNHRVLRVTLVGDTDGVSIRWIHYHVSNDQGRRLTLVFITDESSLEVFAEQDAQIVETLELMAWPTKLDKAALEKAEAVAEKPVEAKRPTR